MFTVQIITPRHLFFEGQASMVVAPATLGEIGLLEDHAPIISSLLPGLLKIYDNKDNIAQKFFIYGGFVEFDNNCCVVLASRVCNISELDIENAKNNLSEAQAILDENHDKNNMEAILKKAENDVVLARSIISVVEQKL